MKEWLEYAEYRSMHCSKSDKLAVLWPTAVSAGIDSSGAHDQVRQSLAVEMVVEQGLPEPFSALEALSFWLV